MGELDTFAFADEEEAAVLEVEEGVGCAVPVGGGGVGGAMSSANSLATNGYGRGASGPPIGQVLDGAQNMSAMQFDSMDEYKSPLINLADGTGGIFIKPGHDIKRPLQQLHDALWRCHRILVDLYLQTGRYSYKQAVAHMQKNLGEFAS